jgi:hypothetical protein
MTIDTAKRAKARHGGAGWRAVTLVLLLAFTLQSFVTQTHLHAISPAGDAQVALRSPHPGNVPLDEGMATCPFCQAAIHAGAFFVPVSPVLVLPTAWFAFAAFAPLRAAFGRTLAHHWHSRAPPQSQI